MDTATDAVVSVIDLKHPTISGTFITKLNSATCAGWPATFTSGSDAKDISYNPQLKQLAIATEGVTGLDQGPSLLIINMDKSSSDYLDCTVYAGATNIVGTASVSYIKFVRYFKSRWWTWTTVSKSVQPETEDQLFWQLGFFDTSGNYTVVAQFGLAPTYGQTNYFGSVFDSSVCFPAQGEYEPVYDTDVPALGTADGYIGDAASALDGRFVGSFEIQDTGNAGELLIGTYPYRDKQNGFGIEAFIFRIDLETLLAEYAAPTVINSFCLSATPVLDIPSGEYKLAQGTVIATGCDFSSAHGYIRIKATQEHTGSYAALNRGLHLFCESTFGAAHTYRGVATLGARHEWHGIFFSDNNDSVKIGLNYEATSNPVNYTLMWRFDIYPLIPGLVECIGIHSAVPIVQAGDADRPDLVESDPYYGETWNLARYLYAGNAWTQIRSGLTYLPDVTTYAFPVFKEDISPDSGDGLGVWTHDGTVLTRNTAASGDLAYDYVGRLEPVADGFCLICSNDSGNTTVALQLFDANAGTFNADTFTAALEATHVDCNVKSGIYNPEQGVIGFATGTSTGPTNADDEVWIYRTLTPIQMNLDQNVTDNDEGDPDDGEIIRSNFLGFEVLWMMEPRQHI
jgi:hypothetical protein